MPFMLLFHNTLSRLPIFDPGGVIEPLSVTMLRGEITMITCLKITFCSGIVFTVEFSGNFAVLVFDPGGTIAVTFGVAI
ncbi:hypothetical protein QL285_043786 [Trifolium repens]|nr:hypothetical protein QL285_043786 [Trifolium repens]